MRELFSKKNLIILFIMITVLGLITAFFLRIYGIKKNQIDEESRIKLFSLQPFVVSLVDDNLKLKGHLKLQIGLKCKEREMEPLILKREKQIRDAILKVFLEKFENKNGEEDQMGGMMCFSELFSDPLKVPERKKILKEQILQIVNEAVNPVKEFYPGKAEASKPNGNLKKVQEIYFVQFFYQPVNFN